MSDQDNNAGPGERVELHDFAAQLDLTPEQVRDELVSGRLAFSIDELGVVFTDRAAVIDWIQRRVGSVALFGRKGVSFPLYAADWRDVEFIPGPLIRDAGVEQAKQQPAEADRE